MKRALVLAMLSLVLGATGIAAAEDACPIDNNVDVTLDATYVTKYLWRGFDLYDDKAAFQPSINMDFNNGFSAGVWYSVSGASGNVDGEEFNYYATYANTVCAAEQYQVDYALNYIYYDFPDTASKDADGQEINLDLYMPNMFSGFTPHYEIAAFWPAQSGGANRDTAGWIHTVGIMWDWTVCGFLGECNPEQTFNFTVDLVYNDGAAVSDVDHDWSHMTYGVSTPIAWGPGTFTPAVYFQDSWEDTVNDEDELYAGFSYTMNF